MKSPFSQKQKFVYNYIFYTMRTFTRIGLLVTIISSSVFSSRNYCQMLSANIASGEENLDIKFNLGQLSVRLKNAPLEKVLKEIMLQSGARIWLSDSIDTTVTIEFQNIPVGEGVHKILKDKNYAFVYTPNERKEGSLSIIKPSKSKEVHNVIPEEPHQKLPPKPVPPTVKKNKGKGEIPPFEVLAKDALEGEDAGKREEAILALGESKDKRAIEIISRVLSSDPSEDVRLSSIDALLMIGDKSAVEPLSIALKDQNPGVRQSALEALGGMGGEGSQELIKSALNDEDNAVRELAQEILDDLSTKK